MFTVLTILPGFLLGHGTEDRFGGAVGGQLHTTSTMVGGNLTDLITRYAILPELYMRTGYTVRTEQHR